MSEPSGFSTILPAIIFVRSTNSPGSEWQELDRGPGVFRFSHGQEVMLRIQHIGDRELLQLVEEIRACPAVKFLHLAENRKITDAGLARLSLLPQLTGLNLSSCDITYHGLAHLKDLPRLEYLNLSYCNRLGDSAIPTLKSLSGLTFLDLQGTIKITNKGLSQLKRRGLTIHK